MAKVQLNFDCRFWLLFQPRHVFSRRPVRWGKAETFLANEGVSVTFGRGMREVKKDKSRNEHFYTQKAPYVLGFFQYAWIYECV